ADGRFMGHVTQNIDGLFADAGHVPEKLVEIHGTARKVRCTACLRFFPYDVAKAEVEAGKLPPTCPGCGGALKPGSVLFGEGLPGEGGEGRARVAIPRELRRRPVRARRAAGRRAP